MTIKLFCIDCNKFRRSKASPILPPQALTPALEELPQIPSFNLDGAFCLSLRHKSSNGTSLASRPNTTASKQQAAIVSEKTPAEPVPQIPDHYKKSESQLGHSVAVVTEKHSENAELLRKKHAPAPLTKEEISIQRRLDAFTTPEKDMVSGRAPSSPWQAVASKVVAANRARKGLGKEIRVEDFKIEELGGRAGPLVFGPVAVFNGNVTMKVKKPIQGATVTITFQGITEVDKALLPFISVTRTLHSGDLQDGMRSFLFGFNFPHVNLPPTSEHPKIAYSFIAEISLNCQTDSPSTNSLASLRHHHEPSVYKSKPLKIIFMPYIDPALETPLVSRKPSMRRKKSRDRNGFRSKSITETPSAHTLMFSDDSGLTSPLDSPKVPKPKLTLTTADLPLSASSNSTPVIDKPHPSRISSAIIRSTRITDDDNETLAKLTVEMPSSRFLPGEDIALKVTLQVRDGFQLPKGMGARVLETRYLASEVEHKKSEAEEENDDADEGKDEDDERFKMKSVGKEQHRVLTGKRFLLHPEGVTPIRKESTSGINKDKSAKLDTGLAGGKEMVEMMKVTLPPFKTFLSESLLPSAALPLGDPRTMNGMLMPPVSSSLPHLDGNGTNGTNGTSSNGKGKASSLDTPPTLSNNVKTQELFFKVAHMVQITIPLQSSPSAGGGHWYRSIAGVPTEDLEVSVPIILGNKNPGHISKYRNPVPELRLNAPEIRIRNGEGSSGSNSRRSGAVSTVPSWREGERFLTLRETDARPNFVLDQD
ncbi:hypothetical protein EDC01DRAFT_523285 [Geopyxis carbonaria]|nr:hypothetical protein EDC01DRAFT_523285 [Geopyxis carbonaria]